MTVLQLARKTLSRDHPARIADSSRQYWTVEELRERLKQAARTLRRMPFPRHGRPAELYAGWPDIVRDWMAYGYVEARAPRIVPNARQIDLLDETLGWLHGLTRDQRMVLWGRAQGFKWRQLRDLDDHMRGGGKSGRSEQTLRGICGDAESRILARLNGTPGRMVIDREGRVRDPTNAP